MFGIPGDSITAIVIGVLYMKNMNPGPTLFTQNPQNIYAVYLLFIIANLLMIPGPIEFEPSVLRALGEKTRSHLDPVFMKAFSRVLKNLRVVFGAPSAQPFVVAGSGTLAMEMAVANLMQPGDKALVVNTGYFSDRIAAMLERHGDWMSLGSADEQKPAAAGTVEAWARAKDNPVGGWYGLKKGLRGRFAMYVPPVLKVLGLAEVEDKPRNNRMRAK